MNRHPPGPGDEEGDDKDIDETKNMPRPTDGMIDVATDLLEDPSFADLFGEPPHKGEG